MSFFNSFFVFRNPSKKSFGLTVEPESSIKLNVRLVDLENRDCKLEISTKYGRFPQWQTTEYPEVDFIFDETYHHTNYIDCRAANELLDMLEYFPNAYDARKLTDIVKIELTTGGYSEAIEIPIALERKTMPIMTRYESNTFQERTTIVFKTFIRYECMNERLSTACFSS